MTTERDPGLDALLDLNGVILVIDPKGEHWVKFDVRRVPVSPGRPHGLQYSLTLHDASGHRLVGYDNAHAASSGKGPGAQRRAEQDHKHRHKTVRPYTYRNAATLLTDFWADVEAVLKERGVEL